MKESKQELPHDWSIVLRPEFIKLSDMASVTRWIEFQQSDFNLSPRRLTIYPLEPAAAQLLQQHLDCLPRVRNITEVTISLSGVRHSDTEEKPWNWTRSYVKAMALAWDGRAHTICFPDGVFSPSTITAVEPWSYGYRRMSFRLDPFSPRTTRGPNPGTLLGTGLTSLAASTWPSRFTSKSIFPFPDQATLTRTT